MKRIISVLTLATLTMSASAMTTPMRPAHLIIGTFGVQCPQVVPRNVGSALVNLNSLYGIVQELKSSNECNGVGQMANVLASYSGLFQNFSTKEGEA